MKPLNHIIKPTLLIHLVLILVGSSSTCQAQQKRISLGIMSGIDRHAIIDSDQDINRSSTQYLAKTSPKFGLSADWQFAKHFGLRMEINYTRRGGLFESYLRGVDTTVILEQHYRLDYLQVPLLFEFNYGQGRLKGISMLGGYFSYKLAESNVNFNNGKNIGSSNDPNDRFKNTDFGLSISTGASYVLSSKFELFAILRIELGLANINPDVITFVPLPDFRNRAYMFNFGVNYVLRPKD